LLSIIGQGLYDQDSNMMAIAPPKDYTEVEEQEEREADELSAAAAGLVSKPYRQQQQQQAGPKL
jgi:hypothetical protein